MEGFLAVARGHMFPSILKACAFALVLVALTAGASAFAHEEKPQFGGVIASVKDVAYELAAHERGLVLYVEDHGNPVSMAGVVGKLVVIKGSQRVETEFKPSGENRMLAAGAQLASGQKATAILTMPSGRAIVVQFPPK